MQFNRFANNFRSEMQGGAIHSSGMSGSQPAGKSFNVRRHIDRNRQMIRGFKDSNVLKDYKKNAHDSKSTETDGFSEISNTFISDKELFGTNRGTEQSAAPSVTGVATPSGNRAVSRTSRIDNRTNSRTTSNSTSQNQPRQAFNAVPQTPKRPQPGGDRPAGPAFREPSSRGYNPYS